MSHIGKVDPQGMRHPANWIAPKALGTGRFSNWDLVPTCRAAKANDMSLDFVFVQKDHCIAKTWRIQGSDRKTSERFLGKSCDGARGFCGENLGKIMDAA